MKQFSVMTVLVFLIFGLSSMGWAQPKVGGPTGSATAVAQPKRSADLKVDNIYAGNCACDLAGVDALYMRDISVHFSGTIKFLTTPGDVVATLKLTYFDLMLGRSETRTVMIQAGHLARGSGQALMVSGPVLIKKSIGVTAEIMPAGLVEVDPNLTNNKKKVTECSVFLI
jgi:hypothetical protein